MPDVMRVLLVEDDMVDAKRVLRALSASERCVFKTHHVASLREAVDCLGDDWDAIMLDLELPDSAGIDTVHRLLAVRNDIPIVVVTGQDDQTLVDILALAGVQDYLTKGHEAQQVLQRSVCYAVERDRLLRDLRTEREELTEFVESLRDGRVDTIVGAGGGSRVLRLLDSRVVEENERLLSELRRANADLQAEIVERKRAEEALEANAITLAATNESLAEAKQHLEHTITQLSRTNADLQRKNAELDDVNMARAAANEALEEAQQALADVVSRLSEANQELLRKNTELDEFTYVASHDLQEPLRKLISFSRLLEIDLGGDLSETARKDLGYITDAARRMQTLVQDLLALSRAGRAAVRYDCVSLDECVDNALEALSGRIEAAGANVTRSELPTVVGDVTLITQLFQNLIGNALKFVPADRRPEIHITATQDGATTAVGVRDNGIGIDEKYAAQVFLPFKRLHGRSEYEGTGIGLAICRRAVERHGGRIWVESQPNAGAHFQFTLCADQESLECQPAENSRGQSC